MELVIEPGGGVRAVYSETIDLTALGQLQIRRVSHVEPDGAGHWWADLTPVAGPALGPFVHRSQALEAELAWLTANWLAPPQPGSRSTTDTMSAAAADDPRSRE
jgi:hypothetical protein